MSPPLLQVKGLGLSLPDMAHKSLFAAAPMKRIFSNISFELQAGSSLGVIGESGSGKSTLARALTLIMPPQEGELLFENLAFLLLHALQLASVVVQTTSRHGVANQQRHVKDEISERVELKVKLHHVATV